MSICVKEKEIFINAQAKDLIYVELKITTNITLEFMFKMKFYVQGFLRENNES